MCTHNHKEADTMIPLHVIDAIGDSTLRDIEVWSPDTDVLILLMDLVTHGRLGAFNKLNLLTGKDDKYRKINIRERVSINGWEKCQDLIRFHNFTGADSGWTFIDIPKKILITSYLYLPNDDPIVSTFQLLGERVLRSHELVDGVCSVYSPGGATTIQVLHWELFRSRNLEGEKLPPTRATLKPHVIRTNIVTMMDNSYATPHPYLLPLERIDGCLPWTYLSQSRVSTHQHQLPSWNWSNVVARHLGHCSCKENNLPCTALCKCHNSDCSNLLTTGW